MSSKLVAIHIDHFAVYQIDIPAEFQVTKGQRTISITLSYDPPVRHSRADYAGISMNFRLLRGISPEQIFDFYKKRNDEDEELKKIPPKYICNTVPKPNLRERGTVQKGVVTFSKDISQYGDTYYLVVRCESGWEKRADFSQRFAVVAEIRHQENIPLYARLRARVKLKT